MENSLYDFIYSLINIRKLTRSLSQLVNKNRRYACIFLEVVSTSQLGKHIYETRHWPTLAILNQLLYDVSCFLALKGREGQNGLPGMDGEPGEVVSRLMR